MTVIFPLKEAGDKLFSQELQGLRNDILTRGEFVVATGSSNAFAITIDDNDGGAGLDEEPIAWPLANGHVVMFEANHSIDGAATLNVNGNGAIAIKARGSEALVEGDIVSGQFVICFYDSGSNVFQMISVSAIPVEAKIKQKKSALMIAGEDITVSGNPKACFIGGGGGVEDDAVMFSNTSATASDYNVYGANWIGQVVISNLDFITSVFLLLDEVGTAPGNFDVSIYETSGGSPTGSPLATASIAGTAAPNSDGEVEFAFSSPVLVSKGEKYAVVASLPSGSSSGNCVQVRYRTSGIANSTKIVSTDSGSSWTPSTTESLYIKVSGYEDGLTVADQITGITQTAGSTEFHLYGVNWHGQTFTAVNDFMTALTLYLYDVSFPVGNFNVSIYATAAGVPTGSALATETVAADSFDNSFLPFDFFDTLILKLTKGAVYAIVMSAPSAVDASNDVRSRYKNSGSPYAGGSRLSSTDSGATWTPSATSALDFVIKGFDHIRRGKVYISDVDADFRGQYDGFISESANEGEQCSLQLIPPVEGFSGLEAGRPYSLDADGEIVAGVGAVYIGRGLNDETLEIDKFS